MIGVLYGIVIGCLIAGFLSALGAAICMIRFNQLTQGRRRKRHRNWL